MTHNLAQGREQLQQVLLDTAADLTELRDLEAVLQAIVHRTRVLLSTDMAYISLTDFEHSETYIRHAEGVITQAYRTIRQPLGTGVLGQVATGLAPVQSSNYAEDPEIEHLAEIDEIVQGEGVQAVMGVPLTVTGRVIGALLVAERHSRLFSAAEIAAVDSLGRYAAIAIDNSMRFESLTRLVEQLSSRQRRDADELALTTHVLDLDRRLMETVMGTPDAEHLLMIGRSALAVDLAFYDADGSMVAATSGRAPEADAQSYVSVVAAGETLGRVVADRLLSETERTLLERVAVHLALAVLFERAEEDADLRRQSEVVEDIIDGREHSRERIERRLKHWGIRSGEPLLCVAIEVPDQDRRRLLQLLSGLRMRCVLMSSHAGHVCMVTVDTQWEQRVRDLFAARGWTLRAGVEGPFDDPRLIGSGHERAELALHSLDTLQRDGIVHGEQLGLLGVVLGLARRGQTPQSLTAPIDGLIAYDHTHHTDLTNTAYVYLESEGNTALTGELLSVHRNTVRQRLERISTVLGAGWDASPRRLGVHLALRIRDAQVTLDR
ncbi:GAF domain-containing protein [Pseudoclavibacter sp. CFCC 13796]|uniref:helix-turn-helix domain-containing protein n=1 Tax=Pseudoclavibacter sp. CFCC 13796 TaxID=2615179 RepID=UPI00130116C2|nr:helix-turn-helix domain-containing protein [Pseudoclavibacter sp. CFCC 13796]KAB1661779.1 GAF domain-containing protein [Pseudoclavibacter sp. CFCC 13796]